MKLKIVTDKNDQFNTEDTVISGQLIFTKAGKKNSDTKNNQYVREKFIKWCKHSGRKIGSITREQSHISLWQHLTVDDSGSTCTGY